MFHAAMHEIASLGIPLTAFLFLKIHYIVVNVY